MASTAPRLRIGQVVDLLSSDFEEVSISKLRFLEEQGLVTPERTAGGYRMYSDEHVRQLRAILQMQRDEFLPLRVIRQELQRRIAGAGAARPRRGAPAAAGTSLTSPEEQVPEAQLLEQAQVPQGFLDECRAADLVEGRQLPDGSRAYSPQEVALVRVAGHMHRLGIDVRHLRQVRSAIARQAALVEQYAAARLRTSNPEARATAVGSVEALTDALAEFMRLAFVCDVRSMTARQVAAVGGSAAAPVASVAGRISGGA